ncbi:Glycine betaine-binding protein OpuAC [Lentibacillus sp. JNUCC-1]|uniref:glycine betaine ABC transporter substrate-binding protein n=1 Tax=Lentibacillus sp. JNUCC-1 TaxID=2654513 RepID=UPI0013254CBE|nr:glycine betaine ABC transporter substrate-binding protein [Lentibacillus sp. JNUCC-1]MUV36594.1 Glycine betaine-binding protein OpuAC [Lentibacillus sp. JNUCC-1]
MNKKFNLKLTAFALILMLSMLLAACGGNNAEEDGTNDTSGNNNDSGNDNGELAIGQEDLTLPYVAWARETLSTYMLANLLEQVGYNVDVKQVEAGPMFSSVADGSADFHTSAWLPATHQSYWEKYEGDIVKVNQVLDKAPLALVVPSYVDGINTMEDLKNNEEFGESVDWKITGIDPGAGIMQNTEKALEEYGLDKWELTTSSEAAMLAELQSAIKDEKPIIVPLWKPHWAFGDMDLKMLEDPKEIYGGEGDQIYTVARSGLEEDAPRAYKVLEQYDETYDMLDSMMPKVYVEDQDPEDVVQEFIDNNPDLVDEWLDGVPTE